MTAVDLTGRDVTGPDSASRHRHTLSFLAGLRGDPIRCLGVRTFGQSSNLSDAYALHGTDAGSVVDAGLGLLER